MLLASCDIATLVLTRGLVTPDDLITVTYNKLEDAIMNYFMPQPTQLAQRLEFLSHHWKPSRWSSLTWLSSASWPVGVSFPSLMMLD